MSTFGAVLRHELRRARRDRALPWLILLFAAVSGYAAVQGRVWAETRNEALGAITEQASEAREAARDRVAEMERRRPEAYLGTANLAMTVWYHPALPTRPLAPLSVGQAEGYPYDAKYHGLTNRVGVFNALGAPTANPTAAAAGPFDLAFVVVFVLPLFLLAGTYDVWVQERELGTSGFLLSHPVRGGSMLAAKAVARGGTLLFALTFLLLIALAAASGLARPEPTGFVAAAAVIILYGCFWIHVAVAVNLLTSRPTEAAMACGAVWLAVVVFTPAALAAVTDLVSPAPSHVQRITTLRVIELDAQRRAAERREAARAALVGASTRPRDLGLRAELTRVEAEERDYDEALEAFDAQQAERRRWAQTLRMFSPAIAAQDGLDRIAGTDAERALAFQHQVHAHVDEVRRFGTRERAVEPSVAIDERFRRLPEFRFREPAAAWNGSLVADVAVLLIFGFVPLAAASLALRRGKLSADQPAGKV